MKTFYITKEKPDIIHNGYVHVKKELLLYENNKNINLYYGLYGDIIVSVETPPTKKEDLYICKGIYSLRDPKTYSKLQIPYPSLLFAITYGYTTILRYLCTILRYTCNSKHVECAAIHGNIGALRFFIDDLKIIPPNNLLRHAVISSSLETIQYVYSLLNKPIADELYIAVRMGCLNIVKYLVETLNINVTEEMLIIACKKRFIDMIHYLSSHTMNIIFHSNYTLIFNDTCSICLEKFNTKNTKYVKLPCNHDLHEKCFDEYLHSYYLIMFNDVNIFKCPLCRTQLLKN